MRKKVDDIGENELLINEYAIAAGIVWLLAPRKKPQAYAIKKILKSRGQQDQ